MRQVGYSLRAVDVLRAIEQALVRCGVGGVRDAALLVAVGGLGLVLATAARGQALDQTEIVAQFGPQVVQEVRDDNSLGLELIKDALNEPDRLSKIELSRYGRTSELFAALNELNIFGLNRSSFTKDPDPLVNFRVEFENFTDETQFYAFQLRFQTDPTAGPTFKDAFANLELIDANGDDFALVTSSNTFIEVVSDTGGALINGSANLGEATSVFQIGEGKISLFDEVGTGPDSDGFGGPGYNFMRLSTNGFLSPGDKVVITGMGAYANDEAYLPDRYEIPAIVPEPTTGMFLSATGLLLLYRQERAAR